jgi:hypothetical protein
LKARSPRGPRSLPTRPPAVRDEPAPCPATPRFCVHRSDEPAPRMCACACINVCACGSPKRGSLGAVAFSAARASAAPSSDSGPFPSDPSPTIIGGTYITPSPGILAALVDERGSSWVPTLWAGACVPAWGTLRSHPCVLLTLGSNSGRRQRLPSWRVRAGLPRSGPLLAVTGRASYGLAPRARPGRSSALSAGDQSRASGLLRAGDSRA